MTDATLDAAAAQRIDPETAPRPLGPASFGSDAFGSGPFEEPFDPPPFSNGAGPHAVEFGRVNLRTLILIRWIAVVGQVTTLLLVRFALGFPLPLDIALGVAAASVLMNLANIWSLRHSNWPVRLGDSDAAMYLAYDIVQLGALLYLTGGLENPFSLLTLAPVIVAATSLSRRSVLGLSILTAGVTTLIAIWHLPLPWDPEPFEFPALYVTATWVGLTLSTLFIAGYTWVISEESRRISDALAATQLALAREQRVSAVGALAAAAAHELGSPLGTIAVVSRELARDLPPNSPYAEDAQLLLSETARCRKILAELSQKREADGGDPYDRLPLSALAEAAGDPHRMPGIQVLYHFAGLPEEQPLVLRSPEILHGLGNFIQNAIQFAEQRVRVDMSATSDVVTVIVQDDGPGFPLALISRLGEPYLSARGAERDEHMGLGIFIATTLLRRTGASVTFGNAAPGARVTMRWPRRAMETGVVLQGLVA